MKTLEVSSTIALAALGVLTGNIVLGVLVWSKLRIKLPRRLTAFKIHKWTGYMAAMLVLLHVLLIPLDPRSGFRWADLFLPLWTRHQPLANAFGAGALWLIAVVIVTSYFQKQLKFPLWRKFHYLAYAAVPLFLIHGLLTDPELKDRPVDWIDAEKVLVEVCGVVVLVAAVYRLRRTRRVGALGVFFALILRPGAAHADQATATPAKGWRLDPDAGLVWDGHDIHFATWGFAQGVIALHRSAPYARRVRQGVEIDFPHIGPVRPAVVYEVDLTDNNFFQDKPRWKIFENAFVAIQADNPDDFRLLYGQNTHILSREDNLPSGNLPTINRSIVLESHGSVHTFGTQWGGAIRVHPLDRVLVQASMGDNRGSLNTDKPSWGAVNDFAAKTIVTVWKNSQMDLTVGLTVDYTRGIEPGTFTAGSAINGAPLLASPASGDKLTGEAEIAWTGKTSWPFLVEGEWLSSHFGNGTAVMGGYVQGMTRVYESEKHGDLAVFFRPELLILRGPTTGAASVAALRTGLDWNLPWSSRRTNVLLECAWHSLSGPPPLLDQASAVWEVGLMLRLSLTRHVRFAE